MKKALGLALFAVASMAAGAASANVITFETASGAAFTNYFSVTPKTTNQLILQVSGQSGAYRTAGGVNNLSFDIVGGPADVAGNLVGGNVVAIFNDRFNTAFSNAYSLVGGQTYELRVSGITNLLVGNVNGVVSIQTLGGVVSAVPEPETYALMLAGLGLVAAMVRRQNKQAGPGAR